ncbi:hypothetical protein KPC_3542 [Acinetobacter stercoris]|uniref:Uncharacterized protein n=1 Tax=Acinetobacter stercoris TaxID=2126983 RepID=A0A2U3N411_9GAMM|nr:hypothetical protein KPC_3542 [Acinetobacter stercoris]
MLPALSVAVTLPTSAFFSGLSSVHLPVASVVVVTVLPSLNSTVTVEPASALPANSAALFVVIVGAAGASVSVMPVEVSALVLPALSVAITVALSPSAIGFGLIFQLPWLSAVVVTVEPLPSSTVITAFGSVVPPKPAALL